MMLRPPAEAQTSVTQVNPMQSNSREFVLEPLVPKAGETGKLPAPEAVWDQSLVLIVCSSL